jgi:hypothetical protein
MDLIAGNAEPGLRLFYSENRDKIDCPSDFSPGPQLVSAFLARSLCIYLSQSCGDRQKSKNIENRQNRSLTFEQPSRLKNLGLGAHVTWNVDHIDFPDSLETIEGRIVLAPDRRLTLNFGPDSRLERLQITLLFLRGVRRTFLRLSERILKRHRDMFEFNALPVHAGYLRAWVIDISTLRRLKEGEME